MLLCSAAYVGPGAQTPTLQDVGSMWLTGSNCVRPSLTVGGVSHCTCVGMPFKVFQQCYASQLNQGI